MRSSLPLSSSCCCACVLLRRFFKGTRSREGFARCLQRCAPIPAGLRSPSPKGSDDPSPPRQAWLAGNFLFPCLPQPPLAAPLGFSAAALCRIRPVFPRLSCPSLTSLVFISFRRPTLVEQLSCLNFLLFDEVRVWEVLEDCLKGSLRFMCRTRQKNSNLILHSLEQELSSLRSTLLLPRGWEERKSILLPCISRACGCYSL